MSVGLRGVILMVAALIAVPAADVERTVAEVMAELPDEPVYAEAREVFEKVAMREVFVDFLTLTAYAQLLGHPVHEAGRAGV